MNFKQFIVHFHRQKKVVPRRAIVHTVITNCNNQTFSSRRSGFFGLQNIFLEYIIEESS